VKAWELPYPEVDVEGDVVLVPVGSTEQHGPHLPLGTDHMIATEIALRVSEETGAPLYPAVPYGVSKHHMGFPATVSLRTETMIELLRDIHRSLLYHGALCTFVVNGHGGNEPALGAVTEEEERFHWVSWWKLAPTDVLETDWGGHADELETSVAMYLFPELVKEGEVVRDGRPTEVWEYPDFHEISETGVKGDATVASPEKGKKIVESVVEKISGIVEELRERYG